MLTSSRTLGLVQFVALLLMAASAARAQDAALATASGSQDLASAQPVGIHHPTTAQPSAKRDELKTVSLRLTGGIGLGRPGLAARAGLAGELWLSDILGIGLSGAILRQSMLLGDDSASESVALVGTLRGAAHGSYAYFSFGAGYAHVKHTIRAVLCLGTECAERIARYHGVVIGAALGWLLHPIDALELGPVLRFDVLVDPRGNTRADLAVTIGFELGFAS